MPTAQPAKKVCVICGADVEGKPRVKDAQGRYVCKGECEAKLAKASTPKGAAEPEDALAKLIAASPSLNAKPCATCGSPIKPDAVVCTHCGTNLETGKKLRTAIIKEKEVASRAGPKESLADMPLGKALAIFAGGQVLLALLGFGGPLLLAGSAVMLGIVGLVSWIWAIVTAFQSGRNGWGWIGVSVLVPIVGVFTGLAFLVYGTFLNEHRASRALFIGSILANIVFSIVFFATLGGDTDALMQQLGIA